MVDPGSTPMLASFSGDPFPASDDARPEFATLVHMLAEAAATRPEALALICEDQQLTYGEYARCVLGLAAELSELGVQGERVGVVMSNSNESLVTLFAAMTAGAQVVFFNPFYTKRELSPLIEDADPRVLIYHPEFADAVIDIAASLAIDHCLLFDEADGLNLDNWRGAGGLDFPTILPKAGDLATLVYSGGTTGIPKGVDHTHAEMMAAIKNLCAIWTTRLDQETSINAAPHFHIWGQLVGSMVPVYRRGAVVTMQRFIPEQMVEQMERHKVTVLSGGPMTFYNGLMSAANFGDSDLSSLRFCFGGGSPFAAEILQRWKELTSIAILEGLGMTEAAPITAVREGSPLKVGSAGPVAFETDLQIVDLETGQTVLPIGELGEIRIRGPQVTKNYRNQPAETKAALRDGWLYTGDIAKADKDGDIFVIDRSKDMAIVGGYNVFPREVDELLFAHPDIREAAALGVPDEYKGEVIWAYVVPKEDSPFEPQELLDYCRENLVAYKRPVNIEVVRELPKTPANKIDKKALLDLFLAGK